MFVAVIPVLNQHDVTEKVIESWFEKAKSRVEIVFIDNGSDEPLAEQPFIRRWAKCHRISVFRNQRNIGVYPTFQQGFGLAITSPFIFYSHNDVEMVEYGWDEKLCRILRQLQQTGQKPGVCGMFGAKGIGTPDIYKAPYDFTQMMRWDCVTVDKMAGGPDRPIESDYEQVVVLDGFSLIVSRMMVAEVMRGEFGHRKYPPHHMYDIRICVQSHLGGYRNFAVDIDCIHHGGVTSTREKWAEEFNSTDLKIHRLAHKVFYEEFRGKLPLFIK